MYVADGRCGRVRDPMPRRSGRWIGWVAAIALVVPAAVTLAAPASADLTASLRSAVVSARGGACPLRSNPLVEQVNRIANESTRTYKNRVSQGAQPVDDPAPGLKALGYSGTKSKLLRGWADNEADAIKALLLQAQSTSSGTVTSMSKTVPPFHRRLRLHRLWADMIYDEISGYYTSVILAGP